MEKGGGWRWGRGRVERGGGVVEAERGLGVEPTSEFSG